MTAPGRPPAQARTDWDQRVGRRQGPGLDAGVDLDPGVDLGVDLPPGGARAPAEPRAPAGLRAVPGRGHVMLDWDPVPGAAGYLVYWAAGAAGPFEPLDHGGGDVLAVPAGPYADTTGQAGRVRYYAVAAVADGQSAGPRCEPVAAAPGTAGSGTAGSGTAGSGTAGSGLVTVGVGDVVVGELDRPWEAMIGSEHLSYLLRSDRTGGQVIGTELREALRLAHDELGVRAVRAHGILSDDLGVYRAGRPHDFGGIDRVYDELMNLGLRPVVELSFMPRDLARDPDRTVFDYGAIISPPREWDRWADLSGALAAHLIERYGADEVTRHWAFEVWNEPNLEVFWSGTQAEYFRLYDCSAAAIKSVHPGLRVGGPASAAAGWTRELLTHLAASGTPLDFLSTHVYGNVPLDLRPALGSAGRDGTPAWWTEWGPTPTHFNPVGDTVFAAAFLLRGMASALGRIEALSPWVASDHFEELGPPPELLHGGFGLLSVGNLRKPRYWALALLAGMGRHRLRTSVTGDGAVGLTEALAARHDDGRIGILIWNGTLDQGKMAGAAELDRQVQVLIDLAPGTPYTVRHYRIDAGHSNIAAAWERRRGGARWPDEGQWQALREMNTLDELGPPTRTDAGNGRLELTFDLPMPGVSYLELVP